MKAFSIGALLVVFILYGVSSVHALSCAEPATPEQNLQDADAVFSGEVITIEELPISEAEYDYGGWMTGEKVTFKVRESWKGVDTPTVTLAYSPFAPDSFQFEQGQHYLVYAYYAVGDTRVDPKEVPSASLTTNECWANKRLADAQDDLRVLGAGSVPLQPATRDTSNVLMLLAVGSLLVISMSGVFVLRQRRARQ